MKQLGIMGVGMVGGALKRYFESQNKEVLCFDPGKGFDDKQKINQAEIVFICVPTPYIEEKGGFDLSFVHDALSILENGKIIVIKSTIVPGTVNELQKQYSQHKFLFNPEFLTEATADFDTMNPNRQIIGYSIESESVALEILDLLPEAPYEKIMRAEEAEMVKYFSNCFYALKVAYANQMYDLCEKLGINYDIIKEAAKVEPMMGQVHWEIFHKGYRGYGGKCLPKDTRAMIKLAKANNYQMSLLEEAEKYNNSLNK